MGKTARSSLLAVIGVLIGAHAAFAQLQSWDKQLAASRRFVVLDAFQSAAVLDKETGLVWQRSLDRNNDGIISVADRVSWYQAFEVCRNLERGNRKGWRVPTIEELSSLIDPSTVAPALPTGHPFDFSSDLPLGIWSATTYALSPALALAVSAYDGNYFQTDKTLTPYQHVLCVRGGSGVNPQ